VHGGSRNMSVINLLKFDKYSFACQSASHPRAAAHNVHMLFRCDMSGHSSLENNIMSRFSKLRAAHVTFNVPARIDSLIGSFKS